MSPSTPTSASTSTSTCKARLGPPDPAEQGKISVDAVPHAFSGSNDQPPAYGQHLPIASVKYPSRPIS